MADRNQIIKDVMARGGRSSLAERQQAGDVGNKESLDNNYLQLLGLMKGGAGGGGIQDAYKDVLGNFLGNEQHLRSTMQTMGPFIASMLFQSDPYKRLQDVDSLDTTMQQYGPLAGKIGAAQAQGLQRAGTQAARSGLGRGAAMAGIQSQAQLGAAGQQADLFTQLQQQSMQNRVQNLRYAHQADQDIARLALGVQPAPRIKQKDSNLLGPIAGALGTAVGGFLGPLGAAAGGMVGGGATKYLGGRGFYEQGFNPAAQGPPVYR